MSTTLEPLAGRLVPLRTRDEVRASNETCTVYVVEVPAKHANGVKDAVQAALPDFRTSEISHLRRVVQFKFLPSHLQDQFRPPAKYTKGSIITTLGTALSTACSALTAALAFPTSIHLSSAPPPASPSSSTADDRSTPAIENVTEEDAVRFFLLCPTRHIEDTPLCDIIRKTEPFRGKHAPPRIFRVTVPSLAPSSLEQAESWTDEYWPIAYKNTNPFGPHPSLVQRNAEEIEPLAGQWLAVARTAGKQISDQCLGEDLGVVVVSQSKSGPEVIAVAGDCRWRSTDGCTESHTGTGNVMAHAVHRAIAMVAKKRLRASGADPALLDRSLFCDIPLTEIETEHFVKDNIASSGYLCVDLDIYLTHEPCLMCSMAILHSRFRRCIFAKRMPRTGAMTSDGGVESTSDGSGLKTGLFWRPSELNWKFLAWEFQEAMSDHETKSNIFNRRDSGHSLSVKEELQV